MSFGVTVILLVLPPLRFRMVVMEQKRWRVVFHAEDGLFIISNGVEALQPDEAAARLNDLEERLARRPGVFDSKRFNEIAERVIRENEDWLREMAEK